MPAALAAFATLSSNRYMSQKQVVPDRIISAQPKSVPAYTLSASRWASAGKMCSFSQVIRGRSSANPRNRVMAAWVWVLTRPGMMMPPLASMVSRAGVLPMRAVVSTAVIVSPVTATAPLSIRGRSSSMVRTMPLVISRSASLMERPSPRYRPQPPRSACAGAGRPGWRPGRCLPKGPVEGGPDRSCW